MLLHAIHKAQKKQEKRETFRKTETFAIYCLEFASILLYI